MACTRKNSPPAQVQVALKRFESWRKIKRGRERIPEPLWAAAVKLCKRYSAHRVSRWLRLNSTALRRRLNGSPAGSPLPKAKGNHQPARLNDKAVQQASLRALSAERAVLRSKRRAPAFVEWLPSAALSPAAASVEYLLEVARAGERTLRIRARGAAAAEVAELACALRRDNRRG